jgi:hypothetical protein
MLISNGHRQSHADTVAPEHGRPGGHEIDNLASDPRMPKLTCDMGGYLMGLFAHFESLQPTPTPQVRGSDYTTTSDAITTRFRSTATENNDKDLGTSYNIPNEALLALLRQDSTQDRTAISAADETAPRGELHVRAHYFSLLFAMAPIADRRRQ